MKIKILGTRGEIEETSSKHKLYSGILINNTILLDCGEEEHLKYNPKVIFISHLHPDHFFPSKDEEKIKLFKGISVYSIEKPKGFIEDHIWIKLKKNETYQYNNKYRITPIPTTHSKKVKTCGFLIETKENKILYTSDMIWINKRYHNIIKDCDLIITDGSTYDRDLIRKDKKTGEVYGHSSIPKLVNLFNKLNTKNIIITHFGKWLVDSPKEGHEKIKELSNDIKVIGGYDGMPYTVDGLELVTTEDTEPIQPKLFPKAVSGIYIIKRHANMIRAGIKKAIVKSIKYDKHIGELLYLITERKALGIIRLSPARQITIDEFKKLYNQHRITEKERLEWAKKYKAWKTGSLYIYEIEVMATFKVPKPVIVPKGVQTFIEHVKFRSIKSLSDQELELYHVYSHLYNMDSLHVNIFKQFRERGLAHIVRDSLDQITEFLFMDIKKYDPTKPSKRQLGDDFRLALGHYSNMKKGKKYEQWKPEDMVWFVGHKLLPEMIEKRHFTFNKPETYTKYAAECFRKAIKEYGKKIPWKTELEWKLPKGMIIEDIDIEYVKGLNDKELDGVYNYIHKEYEKIGEITEPLYNANIFILIEMYKRGTIDETFEDKDPLDKAVRKIWQEYPLPALAELMDEKEPERITLGEVIKTFRRAGSITIKGQPFGSYLSGRIVNEGEIPKNKDIDLILRQYPDPRIVVAIKRMKPKWLFNKVHPVFDPEGPMMGYNIPIHGYSLNPLPKEWMIKGFGPYRKLSEELEKLVVGKPFVGLKPASGFGKLEFWDVNEAWKEWGMDHIKPGISIQEKIDGRRFQVHYDKVKGIMKIITEDRQRDRANAFPEIVSEIKKLKVSNLILDGEMVAFEMANIEGRNAKAKRSLGELIPREDTAALTIGKVSDELRKKIVFVFYDILYLNGKALNEENVVDRLKILQKLIPTKTKYLDVVAAEEANTMKRFYQLVARHRAINGSEGIVAKRVDTTYPVKYSGENRTREWMKIKNLKEVDVMVWDSIQKVTKAGKKLPTWMYVSVFEIPKTEVKNWYTKDVVQWKSKYYAKIGKSYGTSKKANRGDIITVMPIRFREYKKNGKKRVTWMFPYFKELKPEKKEPDTYTTIKRLIEIGTRPAPKTLSEITDEEFEEYLKKGIKNVVIKLDLCPYGKESWCPFFKRFDKPRYNLVKKVKKEHLKFPVACALAYFYRCIYCKKYYYEIETITLPELIEEYEED